MCSGFASSAAAGHDALLPRSLKAAGSADVAPHFALLPSVPRGDDRQDRALGT
jgi:hypothetical protein